MKRRSLIALAAALPLAVGAVLPYSATAHMRDGARGHAAFMGDSAAQVEGRIAYLHSALGITPQQESAWKAVADVMRQNAEERRKLREAASSDTAQTPNLVQRLERQETFFRSRAESTEKFLAAFRPLYTSFSDEQRQAADKAFFGPRRGPHDRKERHERQQQPERR